MKRNEYFTEAEIKEQKKRRKNAYIGEIRRSLRGGKKSSD